VRVSCPSNGTQEEAVAIDLDADPWEHALVACLEGRVRGFIAMAVEPWNRRMSIWHFYVDLPVRERGGGRVLMDAAIRWGARPVR